MPDMFDLMDDQAIELDRMKEYTRGELTTRSCESRLCNECPFVNDEVCPGLRS